ncbi:hypothetical protein BOT46_005273 [Escherichia coli]|uniref:Uncharacterized 8.8 kDa protein in frd-Gp32 intergenic region n=1 Tax=Salmonella phage Manna TaxID=3234042 RepID=A0AB39CAN2_9CAUD|nr:hypothetical protein [Escherichia coli]
MAKVDIDIVDFEYIEEIIRNRYPELSITSVQDSKFWSIQIVIEGPLEDLTCFMANEYCDGMDSEDAEFYMGLIEQ